MTELVRWRYKKLEANTANVGALIAQINDAADTGWELVDITYADKTLGLNSMFAVLRKPADHPDDPEELGPGWKVDPTGQAELRYWNGALWTNHARGTLPEPGELEADMLGRNPTNPCRAGEHDGCKRKWCTCRCHAA